MSIEIKHDEHCYGLDEFLRLDISADVKERVWDDNKASDQLFANCNFIDRQLKILQELRFIKTNLRCYRNQNFTVTRVSCLKVISVLNGTQHLFLRPLLACR